MALLADRIDAASLTVFKNMPISYLLDRQTSGPAPPLGDTDRASRLDSGARAHVLLNDGACRLNSRRDSVMVRDKTCTQHGRRHSDCLRLTLWRDYIS